GNLTGLTTDESVLLPAVVDSTTNAVDNLPLKRRGGSISSPQAREDLTGLLTDGNAETFWRVTRERRPDGTSMVIDLGAILPINRIRFQGNRETFLRAYELFVHDGAPVQLREGLPVAYINQVGSNLEQDEPDIDVTIPLQFVRFIRLISRSGQEFILEEVEVFGDGFAPTGDYLSEVIDLGQAANFGKISLQTRIDPLTKAVLQTRTGSVPDPKIYYRKTEVFEGEDRQEEPILPIGSPEAKEEYVDLTSSSKGDIVDNVEEWSPWSAPYEDFFGDLLSPGNRQYFQFRLLFSSDDARQSAFVDAFSFDYSTPTLAKEMAAEVTPATVTLGESNTFDYYIHSEFDSANDGFDQVQIQTPFKATVQSVELDGVPVAFSEIDSENESSLTIRLNNDRVSESGQLLRVTFDALVTVYGTTFFAKVFDSQTGELGQAVVPGDATPAAQTNRLSIQGALRQELVLELQANPPVFSPNGDGVNDELQVSYVLLRALSQVPIDVTLYDLSGRTIRHLQNNGVLNGPQKVSWNGRNEEGAMAPPGLYLLRLSIETDTGSENRTLLVGLAY
ncbi:MAG: hypothetical protein HN780_03800, partial [Gemmatimonadetes bacterium]|nr:hypothetical protein [Gemmatimonadota bacterium]